MITNLTFTNRLAHTILTSAGFALASAAFLVAPAQADTLTVNLSDATNGNPEGFPTVEVQLSQEAAGGAITATVNVVPGSEGAIGDLRGVFLNLPAGASISYGEGSAITAQAAAVTTTKGNKTTTDFPGIDSSATLDGTKVDFNYGIEIGTQGIADGDDYQTITFTISGASLSDFTSSTFGVRLMSVGVPGGTRDDSSKTTGTAPETVVVTPPGGDVTPPGGDVTPPGGDVTPPGGDVTPPGGTDPVEVPEPLTMGGLILGAGGLMAARRRKLSQKG